MYVGLYSFPSRSPRGALARRRQGGAGCGACAAWFAATHPGGAGAPPGTIRSPCQELADRRFSLRREAREAKRGPAPQIVAVERRKAGRPRQRTPSPKRAVAAQAARDAKARMEHQRLPALHPLAHFVREGRQTPCALRAAGYERMRHVGDRSDLGTEIRAGRLSPRPAPCARLPPALRTPRNFQGPKARP